MKKIRTTKNGDGTNTVTISTDIYSIVIPNAGEPEYSTTYGGNTSTSSGTADPPPTTVIIPF